MKVTILAVGGAQTNIKHAALCCLMQGHEVEIEDNDSKKYERIIRGLDAKITVKTNNTKRTQK